MPQTGASELKKIRMYLPSNIIQVPIKKIIGMCFLWYAKEFKGPLKIKGRVKKNFISELRAFDQSCFQAFLIWWDSPFN